MGFLKKYDLTLFDCVIVSLVLCFLFAVNRVVSSWYFGRKHVNVVSGMADGGHGDITWADGVASIDSIDVDLELYDHDGGFEDFTDVAQSFDDVSPWGDFSVSGIASASLTPATVTLKAYDPDRMTVDDLFVRQLAASGRICEVMGHQWVIYDGDTRTTHLDPIGNEQTCGLCGVGDIVTLLRIPY